MKPYKDKIQVKPDEFLSDFAEQQNVEDFMAFLKSQPNILKNKYAKAEKFIRKESNKEGATNYFMLLVLPNNHIDKKQAIAFNRITK